MPNPISYHKSNFDFGVYKTTAEKVMAAKAALRKTIYGLGKVIEVVPDGDQIKFIISGTGEQFDSMAPAIGKASTLFVTQNLSVTDPMIGNKVSGLGAMLKDITNKNYTANQIKALEAAGIDVPNLQDLKMDIQIMSGGKGDAKSIVKRLKTLRERGEMHGISVMDDQGARVLNFRMGGKSLTALQAHLLLSVSGHSLADPDVFNKIFKDGDSNVLGDKLLKLSKRIRTLTSEREVAVAGADLSSILGGKSLKQSSLITDFQYEIMRKFAHEKVNGGEYKFGAGVLRTGSRVSEESLRLSAAYKGVKVEDYIGSYIGRLSTDQQTILAEAINSYRPGKSGGKNIKDLSDHVAKYIEGSSISDTAKKEILDQFNNGASSAKSAVDGSSLLNSRFLTSYKKQLTSKMRDLKATIDNMSLPADQREIARNEYNNLKNIFDQIKGSNLDDIIGRGHVAGMGDIKSSLTIGRDNFNVSVDIVKDVKSVEKMIQKELKRLEGFQTAGSITTTQEKAIAMLSGRLQRIRTAALAKDETAAEKEIRKLDRYFKKELGRDEGTVKTVKPLKNLAAILTTEDIKREAGLAKGIDQVLLAGFGHPRNEVFLDPISAAVHSDIFSDEATLDAMKARGLTKLNELEDVLRANILPQRLKKTLQQMADQNVEALPNELRASRLRAKQLAQSILELHQSGVGPMESPKMMNMLVKLYSTQVYRERDEILQPVIPEAMRFSVSTEARIPGEKRVLGKGFTGQGSPVKSLYTDYIDETGAARQLSEDVVSFRVKGKTMFFGGEAVGKIKDALGGFDLDDKGIIKMIRYQDDKGRSRIGFNMIRQPTALEERLFARAYFDEDTLTGMFKNQDYFGEAAKDVIYGLRQMVDVTSSDFSNIFLSGQRASTREAQRAAILALESVIYGGQSIEKAFENFGFAGVKTGNILTRTEDISKRRRSLIESTIDAVYRQMESAGTTSVVNLTNADKIRIAREGMGSLVTTTPTVQPRYTTPNVFRVFTEEKAFDMTSQIEEIMKSEEVNNFLNKYKGGARFRRQMQQAGGNFEEVMKVFGRSDPTFQALFAAAFQRKQEDVIEAGGDILGVYVNRSTAISSTMRQYRDFLTRVSQKDATVSEYLLKNFQIGMLSAESVIDLATNPVGIEQVIDEAMSKQIAITEQIGRADYLNQEGVDRAVARLLGFQSTNAGKITSEEIGRQGIENLGKLIGFTRVAGEHLGMDQELMLGIDEYVFGKRIADKDKQILLKGVIDEMTRAQSYFGVNSFTARIEELQKAYDTKDASVMAEALKPYLLKASHKYSSQAKNARVGEELYGYFEITRKANLANIDDIIRRNAVVSQDSMRLAEAFLESNRDKLDYIFATNQEDREAFSELQKANFYARSDYLQEDLLRQIDEASQLKGISMEEFTNAIDRLTLGTRVDIASLESVTGDQRLVDTAQNLKNARRLRNIKALEEFDPVMAQELRDEMLSRIQAKRSLMSRPDPKTYDEFIELIQELYKDQYGQTVYPHTMSGRSLTEATQLAVIGEATPDRVTDEVLRNEANLQARIIKAQFDRSQFQGDFDTLEQRGTASSVKELEDLLSGGTDGSRSISDDVIQSVLDEEPDAPITKVKFKRFSQKIKDGEFTKLFKEPIIRNSALAIGALAIGSLAYSSYRDRTVDDMTGPPLLPGGSPYESNYPTRIPQIPNLSNDGYETGNNYDININGSPEDIEKFNQLASRLSNGKIRTTIFNRIANVAEDPYGSIASSY